MEDFIPDGALLDHRPISAKNKDYLANELATTPGVPFTNDRPKALLSTVYSQEKTSSCVPHAILTQLEYEGVVKKSPDGLSQLHAYRKRINYPHPGCIAADIYDAIKGGQRQNFLAPVKKGHTETQANELFYSLGEKLITDFHYYHITSYKTIPTDVSTGKAVMVFLYATLNEYSREYVTVRDKVNLSEAVVRHAVCLVPNGDFSQDGQDWLTIHDSAAFNQRHLRYVSLDFLLQRAYYAAKVYRVNALPPVPPPTPFRPTEPCQFGDKTKAVKLLQSYLIHLGYLEPQYQTGYYGALTKKAVLEWQLTHAAKFNYVRPVRELLLLDGAWWGKQSIDVAQELLF
jgi:hypothetical protein